MGLAPQKTIVCVIGTRPEAIKMAPVIKALEATPWARCRVLLTGQHRELVDELLPFFGSSRISTWMSCGSICRSIGWPRISWGPSRKSSVDERPDMVLAQGDTTTRGCHGAGLSANVTSPSAMWRPACAPAGFSHRFPKRPTASWRLISARSISLPRFPPATTW